MPHDVRARRDLIVDDVVRDIQQSPNQRLVARDDFRSLRLAIAREIAPHDEAAFGADGHDHRVLDLLRLHQAENLGSEILAPVRPANAAARDVAHPQVHALHACRKHEDLEQRLGQRQFAQPLTFHLERQVILELAGLRGLIGIGAHRGGQGVPQGAQDAVLVGTLDVLERRLDALIDLGDGAPAGRCGQAWIEARREQIGERAGQG